MLSKIRNHKEKGFTIIEVLIVLAIAGLILLVVFLAVPALQRNARNTSRSNDVASILGAMTEYINNNNGTMPNTLAVAADGTLTVSDNTTTTENQVTAKLGYYKSGVSLSGSAPAAAGTNSTTDNTVIVYTGASCNSTATSALPNGPSRAFVATYTLESNAKQCKES